MKPWKRDLAYIREVGPDEPRFDAAVQRVWDRCEELEVKARRFLVVTGGPPERIEDVGKARRELVEALS